MVWWACGRESAAHVAMCVPECGVVPGVVIHATMVRMDIVPRTSRASACITYTWDELKAAAVAQDAEGTQAACRESGPRGSDCR